MDTRSPLKPQQHICNIICETREHHPNFALLLGAGASATSGVMTASAMIKSWRVKYHSIYGGDTEYDYFVQQQPWHGNPNEYSFLFEALFDQPSQRREFIEKCIYEAFPSWGYIYLVSLIRNNVFNTVFTTNFDDLLNEACYQFSSDVRPIVCAHDSSIRTLRLTSKRPKIIKLHGDFLFDNIKNTERELESLEENMRDKFKQYATEFGLIVLGYSGQDRSVMDNLDSLLRFDHNFPHGVYWCVRKGSEITDNVLALKRFPRFNLVEIEGFDEFFAEIHDDLDLDLQPEMIDPYGALATKLNSLLDRVRLPKSAQTHKVIERDIRNLGREINRLADGRLSDKEREIDNDGETGDASSSNNYIELPFRLLAQVQQRMGDFSSAMQSILEQIKSRPTLDAYGLAFELLNKERDKELAAYLVESLRQSKSILDDQPSNTFNFALSLIDAKLYDYADQVLDIGYDVYRRQANKKAFDTEYFKINKAQIKRHKELELNDEEASDLEYISANSEDDYAKIGALIVLGKAKEAQILIDKKLKDPNGDDLKEFLKSWPIFRLLPEMPKNGIHAES